MNVLSRLARFAAGLAVTAALAAAPAFAALEKRVALVVGNGAYTAAPKLLNPVNDAKAMSASLKRLGFQVVEGYDLTAAEMQGKIGEFSDQLTDAKAALVYYAGHGVAFQDDNYLLPTDIVLKTPSDLDLKAVNLSVVLKLMKREDAIDIVILDACRNNPFAEVLSRSAKSRALYLDGGLASVDANLARGTLIAFATDPKKTALDGTPGDHSPFTKALLAHLEDANVPIDTVFNRVRTDVDGATGQQQTPWVNTSLIGEFLLNPAVGEAPASAPALATASAPAPAQPTLSAALGNARLALDDKLWAAAEKTGNLEDYEAYIDAVPSGAFVQMARNRIARLKPRSAVASLDATAAPATAATPIPAPEAMKAETGTKASEDAIGLDEKGRKDVESRLMALGFDPGDFTGTFTFKTRASISEWQKRRGAPVSGYLGPMQYAALASETADMPGAKLASRTAPIAPVAAAPRPIKKKRIIPDGDPAQAQARLHRAPPPPQQDTGMSAAGAFIGGAILGGVLGAAIHH